MIGAMSSMSINVHIITLSLTLSNTSWASWPLTDCQIVSANAMNFLSAVLSGFTMAGSSPRRLSNLL